MKHALHRWVVAGLGLGIAACGGGGSGSACSEVAACGGNVLGTWKIVDSCFGTATTMPSGLNNLCSAARAGSANVTMSGTITYKPDMTFAQTRTIGGSASIDLPASCLTGRGVPVTCDQLNQVFQGAPASGGAAGASGGLPNISCANAAGGCSCTTTIPSQTQTTMGTYTTSGTQLTQNGAINDYCVQGKTMYLRPHQATSMTGSMGTMSATGQIELEQVSVP